MTPYRERRNEDLRPLRHDGSEFRPDDDFVIAPDPAIGEILSAVTSRRRGSFSFAEVTWVGRRGLQRYTQRLLLPAHREVLLFRDVAELSIWDARLHTGAIKSPIPPLFDYGFRDLRGDTLFRISGTYPAGRPSPYHPYPFALAAQAAWSRYPLADIDDMLARGEVVRFHWGHFWLGIARDRVEVHDELVELRIPLLEISALFADRSRLKIRWGPGNREIAVPIAAMSNAALMLSLLRERTGVTIREMSVALG